MSKYVFNQFNLIQKVIENSRIFTIIILGVVLFLSANTIVQAATFTVTKTADTNDANCDADCSLREAIAAANAASTDDVIQFDGTVFSQVSSVILSGTELTIADNGSLTINGAGANLLTISGNNQSRVFFINGGAKVVFNDLTIANGNAGIGDGGGILVDGSQITELSINKSRINNNTAGSNTTGGAGGGIYSKSFGSININNSTVNNNFAGSDGGGIFGGVSKLSITNSTVSGNTAKFTGGGVFIDSASGTLSITNSTIDNNTATFQNGGGIYSRTATITNSTISSNRAGSDGGGIRNSGATTITNSTISNNRAGTGGSGDGGGVNQGSFNGDYLNLRNTIIADNLRGASVNIPDDFRGNLNSQGYNLIETTNNQPIFGDSTGNIIGRDPQLLPLGNYGGTTQTVALKPTSPAIDAADSNNFPEKDQRGISRPQDGDANGSILPDIGAFELKAVAVTNTNNSGEGSFRQALLDANANAGLDTIVFNIAPGGVQTIQFSSDLPRITDPVIIDATTQPGYSGNPIIEIRGSLVGSSYGLAIDAGNTTIRGLVINNFNLGGIGIFNNGGNKIENNFIGTNIAGTEARLNSGEGIRIFNSSNNIIGGISINARNLISGNSGAGIGVNGTTNSNNVFQGNYIGTDITGMVKIPNGREGICLCSSNPDFNVTNNLIGGTTPGAGNLISGNRFSEVTIGGFPTTGNTVQGNLIGTNATGTQAITSTGYGIEIYSARNNIIGGTAAGAGNIITGNTFGDVNGGSGISIERASGNIIQGNFIGTDITGKMALPNFDWGIRIFENSQNNIIGGIESGAGNTIAFNRRAGIIISRPSFPDLPVINNSIRGNSIFFNGELGIDLTGNTGVGVTPNDSCDADTGVNNLQNYPVLTSAFSNGTNTNITGSLNSTASASFAIDFFVSPTYDNANFGEGKIYIGSTNVTTAGNCNAEFNATLSYPTAGSQFITATATDSNGNTSEFSQFVLATGTSTKTKFDFDGDGRSDISVFRPSTGSWYLLQSTNNSFFGQSFGVSTDIVTPADFDGDGKTDFAVFRPENGTWYLQQSTAGFTAIQFGQNGDIPIPADYDGDGKGDIAVYRPSTGGWYRLNSSNGQFVAVGFGIAEDKPTIGDFDGDGKSDIAVFRPSAGSWYRLNSSNNQFVATQFGVAEDKPTPADFDGDGKTDISVFRPSTGGWYRLNSSNGQFVAVGFGISEDKPVAADFDGDGKADIAVFRPSGGNWYLLRSTAGFSAVQFGTTEDKPVPNAFIR